METGNQTCSTPKAIADLKTAADFREFFAAIPDERWKVAAYVFYDSGLQRCCALGHVGVRMDEMPLSGIRLANLFRKISASVARVNDGRDDLYQQPTPKARILAALDDIAYLEGGAR